MTKVAILIPCHISYKGQIDLLDKCILSLLEQILKPNSIYISISFENDVYRMGFRNIETKYTRKTNPKITFIFSKEKKHQMEHLHNIVSKIYVNDYDMLMFCDDDDTYHVQRVACFVDVFNQGKYNTNGIFDHVKKKGEFGGVREHTNLKDVSSSGIEYWCFGIVPSVIVEFFSFFNCNLTLLQHKFGDIYFRNYLGRNSKYFKWIGIPDAHLGYTLYNYNINNPNSICGQIHRGIGDSYDEMLLEVISCTSEIEFSDIIKKYKSNLGYREKRMIKYRYDFCKILYK